MKTSDLLRQKTKLMQALDDIEVIEQSGVLGNVSVGELVLSAGMNHIEVNSMDDLHTVRMELRNLYGWRDKVGIMFTSCGRLITIYVPTEETKTPFPLELWLCVPVEKVPNGLLKDGCKLVPQMRTEMVLVCGEAIQ